MHLIAEVLDKQVLDATGQNAGKADGIVARLRPGQPPLLLGIEVGPVALIRRCSAGLARRYARFDRRFGPGRGAPYRIAWAGIQREGPSLRANIHADETPIFAAERRLSAFVRHIPGA